jgi:hypothetical protein
MVGPDGGGLRGSNVFARGLLVSASAKPSSAIMTTLPWLLIRGFLVPPALHRSLWHLSAIGRRGYPLTHNRAELIVQIDIGGIGISWALFFLLEVINEHWHCANFAKSRAPWWRARQSQRKISRGRPIATHPTKYSPHRRFAQLGQGRWPVRVGRLRCNRREKPRPTMRESRPSTADSAVTVRLVGTRLSRACDHAPPSARERLSSTGVGERISRPRWLAQHRRPRGAGERVGSEVLR